MSGSLPSKFTRAVCEDIARRSLAAGAPANSNPTFREIDAWILGFKRGRQIQRDRQWKSFRDRRTVLEFQGERLELLR